MRRLKSCRRALLVSLGIAIWLVSRHVVADNLFVSDGVSNTIYEYNTSNGSRSTFASGLNEPKGLAFDSSGNLFEADSDSGCIYKLPRAGADRPLRAG